MRGKRKKEGEGDKKEGYGKKKRDRGRKREERTIWRPFLLNHVTTTFFKMRKSRSKSGPIFG